MIKTLQTIEKRDREPYRVPKSVRNAIPIQRIWENGIFQIGKEKYSKTYQITDVNYAVASLDAKQRMNKSYQELLNSQEPGTTTKITVFNRTQPKRTIRENLLPLQGNDLDKLIKGRNDILLADAKVGNRITHSIYATVSSFHDKHDDVSGTIWSIIANIHGGMKSIAYALLVLFFVIGVARTTTNFNELKRPEQALKLFLRFAIAKGAVTYSMDILLAIFSIAQGIISKIAGNVGNVLTQGVTLPDVIQQKILECGFFDSIPLWIVAMISSLLVWVLSFVMILTVYSRFFQLYMYTALAPIPLATFAGEGTSRVGWQYLKSYAGVCLQGAIIVIACIIYSAFAASPPQIADANASAVQMVWSYMGELIFNLLVLVGTVKMSERVVKEMIGF